MTEPDRARRGFWATLFHWRAPIVLVPLVVGLCYSGAVGAQLLWAPAPPASAPAPVVVCWDRSQHPATECPPPSGLPGLRWVFPSFDPSDDTCSTVVYKDNGSPRPLEYSCKVRIAGTTAWVNYSERSSLDRGLNYFANRYDGVRPVEIAAGTRVVYRDPAPRKDGTYEVTVSYTRYPFAVTVSAVNERLRDKALKKAVTFRPERFVLVRPTPAPER
ncbi:hypothetical protein BH09ACT12_BH09ACT12_34210 [soil metagenome]